MSITQCTVISYLYISTQEEERTQLLEQYRTLTLEAERYNVQTSQLESESHNMRRELQSKDQNLRRLQQQIESTDRELQQVGPKAILIM